MESYFEYLIKASLCLLVFYAFYFLFLKKETGFKFIRYYLLLSLVFSLIIPLNTFSFTIEEPRSFTNTAFYKENSKETFVGDKIATQPKVAIQKFNYYSLFIYLYIFITVGLILKFLVGIIAILFYFLKSETEKLQHFILVRQDKLANSFSFFNLIFFNRMALTNDEIQKVIAHEKIHASQYHSFDIILIELLSAVMWFNPVVWLFRKSLKQVHEYLADEGVLNEGIDKIEYQTLLINQVAESRMFNLASNFNSHIKNRILMMKKLKTNRTTKIKFFILVPVAALLLTFISCVNNSENLITAVAPTKMNVLYLGVDNPVNISVSEHKPGDVRVEIDNGTITGENGNYIVHPKVSGKEAKISVYVKDKKVNESVFRVKIVPDPVPEINNRNPDWTIKKEILLNEPGIYAEMKNFDFDLHFTVVEFTLSAVIDGFNNDAISNSDKFTPKQKEIISKLKSGQKVYLENIKAVGPDSAIRKLGVIILKLE